LWDPSPTKKGSGPLLVLIDNGFTTAHDWRERSEFALAQVQDAVRSNRAVALVASAEAPTTIELAGPDTILARLNALKPAPYLADRSALLPAIQSFLGTYPQSEILWIEDGIAGSEGTAFAGLLAETAKGHSVTVVRKKLAEPLGLALSRDGDFGVRVLRAEPNGRNQGMVRVLDTKAQPLVEAPFQFADGATETNVSFDLPTELRNTAARIDIVGENSAGAVTLIDERNKRRSVGIVSGTTIDQSQPLLSPVYYVVRALQPFAEIRQGRGGVTEAIAELLEQKTSVLILADVGTMDEKTHAAVARYVEDGSLLIRFAGTRLAAGRDDLVPVRLRQGDRDLGSALSWSDPKKLAPFPLDSPFHGLTIPEEVSVKRQILAEPDSSLASRTWASLEDGTPLVTAEKRGNGTIVLFHVTATPTWSNLPLSGLLVDMLRRTIAYGQSATPTGQQPGLPLAPRLILDGYGAFSAPPASSRPVASDYAERATRFYPPGFYGPAGASIAVNALAAGDKLARNDDSVFADTITGFTKASSTDLRMPLYLAAIVLLLIDTLLVLWLGGMRLNRKSGRAASFFLTIGLITICTIPVMAQPMSGIPGIRLSEEQKSALVTRLAYVVTGDNEVDAISQAGLKGLSQILNLRTAFEPVEPIGVDPERDELAFYPLLYWPIVPSQSLPSAAAIAKLDAFMKNGGTILFDTRDALTASLNNATPESASLRRLLQKLDVPQLERLPQDHVLSKTFYILEEFPGRYNSSPLWVESSTRFDDDVEEGPVHAGDGVSPIIITGNDFAAAWAIGPRNETLYPISGSDPQQQREMAFRAGINIVLYTLTGNYKADQVHVPELLRRLGRQGER